MTWLCLAWKLEQSVLLSIKHLKLTLTFGARFLPSLFGGVRPEATTPLALFFDPEMVVGIASSIATLFANAGEPWSQSQLGTHNTVSIHSIHGKQQVNDCSMLQHKLLSSVTYALQMIFPQIKVPDPASHCNHCDQTVTVKKTLCNKHGTWQETWSRWFSKPLNSFRRRFALPNLQARLCYTVMIWYRICKLPADIQCTHRTWYMVDAACVMATWSGTAACSIHTPLLTNLSTYRIRWFETVLMKWIRQHCFRVVWSTIYCDWHKSWTLFVDGSNWFVEGTTCHGGGKTAGQSTGINPVTGWISGSVKLPFQA